MANTLRQGNITFSAADRSNSFTSVASGNGLSFSGRFGVGSHLGANGNLYIKGSAYINGNVTGAKVYNAVWNDVADFQLLNDELVYGKCYYDTIEGARICNQRCQLSAIGIASDTFGVGVGEGNAGLEVPIAIGGWVLAYVDKDYEPGTPLTNDEHGNLTEMTLEEKRNYPERLLAIYKKPELKESFGDANIQIEVNGRHWVKVK